MIKVFALLLAVGLVASPARAADFTQILLDDDGCPLKNDFSTQRSSATIAKPGCPLDKDKDVPVPRLDLTLGDLVYYSLGVTIMAENPQPSGDDKFKRAELGKRLRRESDVRLSGEEIVIIKKVVGLIWPPSTVGLVFPLIDPALRK